MPFRSKKQRTYLKKRKPAIYKKWKKKYTRKIRKKTNKKKKRQYKWIKYLIPYLELIVMVD